jgi:hypothetical protein
MSREAEGLGPVPDGFVGDGDAALREDVFDVSEAQIEAVVEPDRVADDRGRESLPWIAGGIVGHLATLLAVASS